MLCSSWLLMASTLLHTSTARFDWTSFRGRTRLSGNSFGVGYQNASYDYVIVGGGTAGLIVAYVLAQHSGVTVAVVEAGGFYELDNGNVSQVPGYGSTYLAFQDLEKNYNRIDWDFITAPQKGLNNRRIHYTAGRTLGGSSAVNDMIFHRGTKGSMDWWANVTSDDSYKWDNFYPYLKKSVTFTPPNRDKIPAEVCIPYDAEAANNSGSPLHISYPNYRQPFDPYLEIALNKNGLKLIPGFNSGSLDGYGAGTYTIDPAAEIRSSSAEAFMQDALGNLPSLTTDINTMAQKVLFDDNKVAKGVQVETNGGRYTLSARKEVVVSAGVSKSPQVLMLSGIGPAEQLKVHDIPVFSDLHGVGNNLIDQTFIFTNHEMNLTTNSGVLTNPDLATISVQQYLNEQNGPLTGVGGDVIGWEKIPNRTAFTPEVRAQLDSLPADWAEAEYLGLSHGANPIDDKLLNNYVFLTTAVFAPFSKGYINITSTNAKDPPVINPNSLSSDAEAALGVQALKRMREFAEQTGIQIRESAPGPMLQTDGQILDWIRNNSVNGYHASSTCRMGKADDPDANVDSKARVYGVKNLRVVDASAFAVLPPGHPISTIYALGYKIAEDMLSLL